MGKDLAALLIYKRLIWNALILLDEEQILWIFLTPNEQQFWVKRFLAKKFLNLVRN